MSPKLSDKTVEDLLRRRMRENDMDQLNVARIAGKSRTWVGNQLFANPVKTLWNMFLVESKELRELAQAFGYHDEYSLFVELGLFDAETLKRLARHVELDHASGDQDSGRQISRTVKIPNYGPVGSGLKKIHGKERPVEYVLVDLRELPGDADLAKLLFLEVDNDTITDEIFVCQILQGSKLLIERGPVPVEGKIVVGWIPELEMGVVKRHSSQGESALLRSYKVGGPTFWASQYPDMVLEGVVTKVIWNI